MLPWGHPGGKERRLESTLWQKKGRQENRNTSKCCYRRNLAGGSVDKNSCANSGNTDWTPGPGKLHVPRSSWTCVSQPLSPCCRCPRGAHEPQLPSPCAATTEALTSRAHALRSEKLPQWEVQALQRTGAPLPPPPHSPQLEKSLMPPQILAFSDYQGLIKNTETRVWGH